MLLRRAVVILISVAGVSSFVSSTISANTITTSTETNIETIFFTTDTSYDNTMRDGTSKVLQEGKNGSKSVTYLITYRGGKYHNKEKQSEEIIEEAVTRKVVIGTKKYYTCSNGTEYETVEQKNECENRISWERGRDEALRECYADPDKFDCWYDAYPGTNIHWTEYVKPSYNNSGIRYGAICRDGTSSSATGRGACSHHGGVSYWLTY